MLAMIIEKGNNKIANWTIARYQQQFNLKKKKKNFYWLHLILVLKKAALTQAVIWTQVAVDRKHWMVKKVKYDFDLRGHAEWESSAVQIQRPAHSGRETRSRERFCFVTHLCLVIAQFICIQKFRIRISQCRVKLVDDWNGRLVVFFANV